MADQPVQVYQHKIDPDRTQMVYLEFMEVIDKGQFKRGEVVAAAMVMLGIQYHGEVLPEPMVAPFVTDLANWLSAYFAQGTKQ